MKNVLVLKIRNIKITLQLESLSKYKKKNSCLQYNILTVLVTGSSSTTSGTEGGTTFIISSLSLATFFFFFPLFFFDLAIM